MKHSAAGVLLTASLLAATPGPAQASPQAAAKPARTAAKTAPTTAATAATAATATKPQAAVAPATKPQAAIAPATKPQAAVAPATAPYAGSRVREPLLLRYEDVGGLAPSAEDAPTAAGRRALTHKDDDSLAGRPSYGGAPKPAAGSAAAGPFAPAIRGVEEVVKSKRPRASVRVIIAFDVDRRGRVIRPMVTGLDLAADRAIEERLTRAGVPTEYAGQHIETVLTFRAGQLLRR